MAACRLTPFDKESPLGRADSSQSPIDMKHAEVMCAGNGTQPGWHRPAGSPLTCTFWEAEPGGWKFDCLVVWRAHPYAQGCVAQVDMPCFASRSKFLDTGITDCTDGKC